MRAAALRLVAVVVAAGAVVLLATRLSDYHQLVGGNIATFFIAILGLNILTGYTGQISLGHGAFMAIGGYTTAILYRDHAHTLPWHSTLSTVPVAAAAAFVVGVLVGIPALRLRGVYLALATFAFALVVPALANKYTHFSGGRDGILLPIQTGHWSYVVGWSIAGGMFVLAWLCLRGRTGRAWRAIRDSDVAAVSAGVNPAVYKTLAFAASAAFAGVAGSLFVLLAGLAARRVRTSAVGRAADRGGRRWSRLALGRARWRVLRLLPPRRRAGHLDRLPQPAQVRIARPARNRRDSRHVPAADRARGPAAPPSNAAPVTNRPFLANEFGRSCVIIGGQRALQRYPHGRRT
jgi:ABC-type branched-subunit amino acid transport system permease subunit